jgi:hypothetical protein
MAGAATAGWSLLAVAAALWACHRAGLFSLDEIVRRGAPAT